MPLLAPAATAVDSAAHSLCLPALMASLRGTTTGLWRLTHVTLRHVRPRRAIGGVWSHVPCGVAQTGAHTSAIAAGTCASPANGVSSVLQHRRYRTEYRSARVALRKRLGQHLLKSPETVAKIVEAAELTEDDHVMEIGPGTGNLTVRMARRVAWRVACSARCCRVYSA